VSVRPGPSLIKSDTIAMAAAQHRHTRIRHAGPILSVGCPKQVLNMMNPCVCVWNKQCVGSEGGKNKSENQEL
jgi:hypothetical protein